MKQPTELGLFLREQIDRRYRGSVRAAANYIGVAHTTIHDIISGASVPNRETCKLIADWADVPDEYILHLAGYMGGSAQRDSQVESRARPTDRPSPLSTAIERATQLPHSSQLYLSRLLETIMEHESSMLAQARAITPSTVIPPVPPNAMEHPSREDMLAFLSDPAVQLQLQQVANKTDEELASLYNLIRWIFGGGGATEDGSA